MNIRLAQLIVGRNMTENKEKIVQVLNSSEKDEWVLFPEGMLSGYYPEEKDYLNSLKIQDIESAIEEIRVLVKEKEVYCIFGTAYFEQEWYNSSIVINKLGNVKKYYKNNLATLDRSCFKQGNNLEVYKEEDITFGVQMCRELMFPEQWKVLKKKAAQVVFHINNSIKVSDGVRNNVLIARAMENQYFVCSINNASAPQTMSSVVISPLGKTIYQTPIQKEAIVKVSINLDEVLDNFIQQEREDLVHLVYK